MIPAPFEGAAFAVSERRSTLSYGTVDSSSGIEPLFVRFAGADHHQMCRRYFLISNNAKGWIRTSIAQGFNLPLYHWSYLGEEPPVGLEPTTSPLGPGRSSDRAAAVQCARLDSNQQLPI